MGEHLALVNAPYGSYVDVVAYVVETKEQQTVFEHYETYGLRLKAKWCRVELSCGTMAL